MFHRLLDRKPPVPDSWNPFRGDLSWQGEACCYQGHPEHRNRKSHVLVFLLLLLEKLFSSTSSGQGWNWTSGRKEVLEVVPCGR
jgi:hypothetical protein